MNVEQLQHELVGSSPAMRELLLDIARFAPSDSAVLIQGENGTGKELIARALHRNSPRSGGPFVAVNCAAIPENLTESELFGYEKGAFTGATATKPGKFELASGGTLFLDEVEEMPPMAQAKLLRVLQESYIERVGGTRQIAVDIRIIAATNVDMQAAIAERKIREDFYFRLAVVCITSPPLRERIEDIPLLAMHFLSYFAGRARRNIKEISDVAEMMLLLHDWRGNVRELRHAMESAVLASSSDVIRPEDLPKTIRASMQPMPEPLQDETKRYVAAIRTFEGCLYTKALRETDGNRKKAARLLGRHRSSVSRSIRRLNINCD